MLGFFFLSDCEEFAKYCPLVDFGISCMQSLFLCNNTDVRHESVEAQTFYLTLSSYSLKARNKVTEIINKAIVNYREDIDLQNLIDFGQKEVGISFFFPKPCIL